MAAGILDLGVIAHLDRLWFSVQGYKIPIYTEENKFHAHLAISSESHPEGTVNDSKELVHVHVIWPLWTSEVVAKIQRAPPVAKDPYRSRIISLLKQFAGILGGRYRRA
jgi:hypothetical protein